MSNFEWKKLSEVVEVVIDNRGRNPKSYTNKGIPVIDNYLITSDGEASLGEVNRYINEETYNSFLRKYIVKGDVLMTLVGNGYGKVATTPKERCAIIQNTIGLRCNKDYSNQFLYYLLRNNRESLMNLNRGAAQPSIKVGDVLDLEFGFPPIDKQNRIANILGSIDKKIQLNHQINQTLEQMAQALFKSWFVDFDPVKAKMAVREAGGTAEQANLAAMQVISGKTEAQLEAMQSTQPEQYAELKATADLFPDAMQDSELGDVPACWKSQKINEFGAVVCGKTPSKKKPEFYKNNIPFIKIPDMHGNMFSIKTNEYLSNEGAKSQIKKQVPAGSICVSCIATVGQVVITTEESHTNQQINTICCGQLISYNPVKRLSSLLIIVFHNS